jgi:hypothetical protein
MNVTSDIKTESLISHIRQELENLINFVTQNSNADKTDFRVNLEAFLYDYLIQLDIDFED